MVKALIFSPLIGFVAAALLLLAAKALLRNPALFKAPEGETAAVLDSWIAGVDLYRRQLRARLE